MNRKNVLRILPFVIAIGLLCLLGIGGCIYFDRTGTPWERATARKYLEAYLQKRFTQKMVIEESELNFMNPADGFSTSVHPEGNSDFRFRVRQVKRYSPNFYDDYYAEAWETEAEARIQAFLQTIYTVEIDPQAKVDDASFSELPQWGITPGTSFTELRGKVSDYRLGIWVTPDFDQDHPDREYEKMYRVIQFLKESDLVPWHMEYIFGYRDPGSDEDDGKYIWYFFSQEDIQAITSVQTMIAILEKSDNGSPIRKVFH